jgi:flagellar biosynthesis protein FlhF
VPLKTFIGTDLATLLRQAQAQVGRDALIVHVRRIRTETGSAFEIAAADPATAGRRAARGPGALDPRLETMTPVSPRSGQLVLAVVGRTGAGKTTAVAKLATHPRLFPGRRIGLLSLDTFRVGAVEQLATYAAIARLPLEIAYRPQDLAAARRRLADRDVILVDTPGRSPRQRRDRESLEVLLDGLRPGEVHLAIPAGTPLHLAAAAADEAAPYRVTHLLATKIDEAPDDAAVFNLAVRRSLPMRWVTTGQDVPFDLGSAAESLAAARLGAGTQVEAGAIE